jgi:hypothetical protein
MKKLLLISTAMLFSTIAARADVLSLGYLDPAIGGPVTTLATSAAGPGTTIQLLDILLGSGFGFAQFTTLLIPANQSMLSNPNGLPTFETAWNDGFTPPQGGTIHLYGSWQGAITASNALTLPSIFQTNEMPPVGAAGFTVTEQIFLCASAATVFCDNSVIGGGTLVGQTTINGVLDTTFPTFTGLAPGQPFTLTEAFTFSHNVAGLPQGDVGAAILTTPFGVAPVPGPIVGAGFPGLLGFAFLALCRLMRRRKPSARPDFAGPRHWQIASH